MKRLTALLLLLFPLGSGSLQSADPTRPNILFLLADDLGYEMLGAYGSPDKTTPNLDQFATEGMRFDRAYGSPVCTPTRVSLYAGLYPTRHGYTGVLPVHRGTDKIVDFAKQFPTYAQQLREAGYLTSVTGKWQLATLEHHPHHIRDAGFDSWCIWQIWKEGSKTTRYWDPCFNEDGEIRNDISEHFGPDVLADYVIEQMEEAIAAKKPFCIHHNMLLPHWPILETPNEKSDGSKPSVRKMIRYMDTIVGRLVAAVDELGIAENTCIIFLGDNGTDLPKQPRTIASGVVTGGKTTLDHGGTHLPLLIRWPGTIEPGSVANDIIDVADFFPTFCELAGVEIAETINIDGISFAGRILRDQPSERKYTVAAYQKGASIFDGQWRVNSDGTVLDSRDLPREKKSDETQPELAEKLRELLSK